MDSKTVLQSMVDDVLNYSLDFYNDILNQFKGEDLNAINDVLKSQDAATFERYAKQCLAEKFFIAYRVAENPWRARYMSVNSFYFS